MEIREAVVTLDDDQNFEDEITVTLTRQQWIAILPACVQAATDLSEMLDEIRRDAKRGVVAALLIGPGVSEQGQLITSAIREITEKALPQIAEEADRITRGKAN